MTDGDVYLYIPNHVPHKMYNYFSSFIYHIHSIIPQFICSFTLIGSLPPGGLSSFAFFSYHLLSYVLVFLL
ncbi:hypothetical protein V1514DRAFT_331007 [Lipomyces japonicus]|uniref:uncharacterized protein n=1 Tax=Lipomyces japonicus TaxID=56871 RepID=UPI0034CD4F94